MFSKKSMNIVWLLPVFLAVIVIILFFYIQNAVDKTNTASFFSMDTFVSVSTDKDITKDIEEVFRKEEDIFDFHNENSEVSKLNSSKSVTASDDLLEAVNQILSLNEEYGNGADITVGSLTKLWDITGENPLIPSDEDIKKALEATGYQNIEVSGKKIELQNNAILDFGCAAKGYTLDKVKKLLEEHKSERTVISTGSSVLLYGEGDFTVSIMSPESRDILGSVTTKQCFLSTSGGYERYAEIDGERYCHIMDTQTGRPTQTDLTTVTVFCDSGINSDFLSTLIFTGGTENIGQYLSSDKFKVLAADTDKNLYISDGIDFELKDDSYELQQ